jgi:hypothetical protein
VTDKLDLAPGAVPADPHTTPAPARALPTYAWWLVLCLVGLDYFSTLAYLPSMAVEAADSKGNYGMAPLGALAVVAVTLFLALPVYCYVVGRSPHGEGATGLLERRLLGWGGKIVILFLLGFVATDFVITRTLSVADAAKHLTHNPWWQAQVERVTQNKDTLREQMPLLLRGQFFDWWDEQLVLAVILSVLAFGFYALLRRGFSRGFMYLAAGVVALYLALNAVVVGSGLWYLAVHPAIPNGWMDRMKYGQRVEDAQGLILTLALTVLPFFPRMALGLSGFELSMASAPLVRGRPGDDPARPRGRIRNTRKLLAAAALIMSVFMAGSVLVVTLLVPPGTVTEGAARHRALAYLAHGGAIRPPGGRVELNPQETPTPAPEDEDAPAAPPAEKAKEGEAQEPPAPPPTAADLNRLFGPAFGGLYDLSTILILCLAGASVTISLRNLVPHYLTRYGMQMRWAQRVNVIMHLFNVVILTVIIFFQASVSHQQGAYATSVLVLLTSASLAAVIDLRARWHRKFWAPLLTIPLALVPGFFLVMAGLVVLDNPAGLAIALLLVAVIFVTAFVSRWLRSSEPRFEGFTFADEASQGRWEEISKLEFQVLVPHRPDHLPLAEKDREIRQRHRLGPDVPIIFVEAELGDPSEFSQTPLMEIIREGDLEVIRVAHCTSIAHVLAAIALAFREVGRPPEVHFAWSEEPPLAALLNFLLWGEGNIPLLVHTLLRKAEHDPAHRPRVVIG